MNKLGIVLGATALVVAAGCMDPNYELPGHIKSQNDPAQIGPETPEQTETGVIITDVTPVAEEPGCKCPPGTVHVGPCKCGAPDCQCIVEEPATTSTPQPVAVLEPEPATTTYIVQNGDYLAKISKKYNIKLDAIRKANPQLKDDKIRVGQKIQLPGKVDVGEQKLPPKPVRPAAPAYQPYTGATKDYKVVGGDTLGKIAYSNGINIRQLKELNGLTGNNIRIGQTLKIPATKQEKPVAAVAAPAPVKPAPVAKKAPATAPAKPAPVVAPVAPTPVPVVKETVTAQPVLTPDPVVEPVVETVPEPIVEPEAAPAPAQTVSPANEDVITYVVQEGEDIAGVAVTFSVDSSVIRELNNLGPDEQLKPGQIIKIPASAL